MASARLEVGPLAATKMYCVADGVMRQEAAYLAALETATVYGLVGAELQLGPAPGIVSFVFKAE